MKKAETPDYIGFLVVVILLIGYTEDSGVPDHGMLEKIGLNWIQIFVYSAKLSAKTLSRLDHFFAPEREGHKYWLKYI